MKNKKRNWKTWISFLFLTPLLALTVAFTVSCTNTNSTNITNNSSKSQSKSSTSSNSPNNTIPKSAINKNGALSANNSYENGSLTKLNASWENTLNSTNNIISIQKSNNYLISIKTNAPSNSDISWYITNNPDCLISQSIALNTLEINNETSSINIPSYIANKLTTFTYYVFAIISNANAKYPVQTASAVLNLSSQVSINVQSGWLKNNIGVSGLCIESSFTLNVEGLQENIINNQNTLAPNSSYTYTWSLINSTGSSTATLPSTTSTLTYKPVSIGYLTIQCTIKQDSNIIADPTLNLYINNWATLTISNPNMVNDILTIQNTNQSLSAILSNNFIPTDSTLTYQWYEKTINKNNLTNNLLFNPVGTNTSSFSLSNISASYTSSYKLIISFTYNNSVYKVTSNIVQVYYQNNIGSISIANTNNETNIIVTNGTSVTLSINTTKLLTTNISYQWQEEENGKWININNATGLTYTVIENNNQINKIRVVATALQNWNDSEIISNTVVIKTNSSSNEAILKYINKSFLYFRDNENLKNYWLNYSINNQNQNYWSLYSTKHSNMAIINRITWLNSNFYDQIINLNYYETPIHHIYMWFIRINLFQHNN